MQSLLADGHLYLALLVALVIVNLLPPIPAETIIPLSATLFAHHTLNVPLAIMAATIGLVAGTLPLYYLGRLLGEERLKLFLSRHSRWLAVTPQDIDRSGRWFCRYGNVLMLVGRLVPGMRSLISIPAGFHGMRLAAFLWWTTLGSAAWAALLVLAGRWLSDALPSATSITIQAAWLGVLALFYVYRVMRHRSQTRDRTV